MARKTKMNNITSPELLAQVNPANKELMEDFLSYLGSVGRSTETIKSYRNDLEIAFVWCLKYNQNTFFCDWTKRQVVKYQDWLINNNENKSSRVRRLKATLSSLSNYIELVLDDEFPNFRNIIKKIESPPNQPSREKVVWEEDEIEALLKELVDGKRFEIACMLALGAYSGRRKAELCRFRVSDFSDDKLVCDGALYKSDPIKTKGRGEGKFINCYTLAFKFKPYLDLWMAERERLGINSEWLFPNKVDPTKHLAVSTANSWAVILTNISGRDFYWHSMRHLMTTSLAKAGIPDSVIQSVINWESADMVRLYDDTSTDEQISMYFNNGGINAPKAKSLSEL